MAVLVSVSSVADVLTAVTLNWVKGRLIGKGSYGRVYLAFNVTSGDMMAVKQVEQAPSDEGTVDPRQKSMIDALQGEISLLKDLYHTNIVTYLGCETSPKYVSIFLEYVPGGTIAAIYRTPNQGRFEEQLVKYFTGQILDGLAYLHDKGIWHRDLKGDNILVDASGVCKISDFGISKQTSDVYDSYANGTMMKGSVFWMAPEIIQSQGERSYSGKVDIWSLGCVVLEMWTGARPWSDVQEQMQVILMVSTSRIRALTTALPASHPRPTRRRAPLAQGVRVPVQVLSRERPQQPPHSRRALAARVCHGSRPGVDVLRFDDRQGSRQARRQGQRGKGREDDAQRELELGHWHGVDASPPLTLVTL